LKKKKNLKRERERERDLYEQQAAVLHNFLCLNRVCGWFVPSQTSLSVELSCILLDNTTWIPLLKQKKIFVKKINAKEKIEHTQNPMGGGKGVKMGECSKYHFLLNYFSHCTLHIGGSAGAEET